LCLCCCDCLAGECATLRTSSSEHVIIVRDKVARSTCEEVIFEIKNHQNQTCKKGETLLLSSVTVLARDHLIKMQQWGIKGGISLSHSIQPCILYSII